MATIEIPKVRKESTVIMYVSLTDNGVTVDWTSLSEIKPFMYSDEQHCIAGKCTAEIATGAPETLIVRYPTTAPQFLGQNSLLIRCTYDGNEKSFDVPVLEFVDRSSEATGVTVIEDPELPVAIEVQDVDTSVLDDAIAAALNAAAKATAAAELVPLDILAQCQAAAEAAEAAAENCAPVIGDNGNWWIYDYDAGEYVDSGKPSRGIQGEQGIQGIQGIQGNTGSSVDYPYELVNNRTTDDATKGLSAAEGKRLGDDLSQLDQEVSEKFGRVAIPIAASGMAIYLSGGIGTTIPQPRSSSFSYSRRSVSPGDIVVVNGHGGQDPRLWGFIDADSKILSVAASNADGVGLYLVAPPNAAEVIINTNNTTVPSYYVSKDSVEQQQKVLESETIPEDFLRFADWKFDTTNVKQGLFKSSDGQLAYATGNYPNYRYCEDYFPVLPGGKIRATARCQGSYSGIIFYDANKVFVSSVAVSVVDIEVDVPANAHFVRLCSEQYGTSGLALTVYGNTSIDGYIKPYFGIDRDAWIANEETHDFYPTGKVITQKYIGEVTPEKRFIALGFDDFRASDFSFIVPMLEKYGARAEFNRVHYGTTASTEDKARIEGLIKGAHEIGDHTWKHYAFPFLDPLLNGQDPASPEGEQVPFPSNDQLRNDAGDGKNVFGRTLTDNVKTDLGYNAPDINTTWANLTDAQCQQIRDYYSLMKDTSSNLVVLFDELSNTYLGTTGSSRGSWDAVTGKYTGGIYTGCRTSCNHEVWERILLVTNMFLKDKFGLNFNLLTWSLPGSKNSGCTFPYNGARYYDAEHTKRYGNLARFQSSLYLNNDGTGKERSWTDVLREFGYRATHDAIPTSRDYCMRLQFIMNAYQSRPDALPHPTNKLMGYDKIASEYTEGVDLTGTEPYEVQMYDGGISPSTKYSFRNEIEQWRHSSANGVIWGALIDSNDTWSERMILEGLLKYGTKTGYEFVTHGEAYDICFNHRIKDGNLVYNPRLRNTAKEFMPTATTVPSNPDGYRGECSVEMVDGTPVLTVTGDTNYRHYGIPYGRIKYSADVKGNGTITIRAIKNKTEAAYVGSGTVLATISINNNDFEEKVARFVVGDGGLTAYEDVFGGYGEKIIGLYINYSSGIQIKNIDLRLE